MSRLNLFLLGPPRIELDGESISLNNRKAIALFSYIVSSGSSHSRDSLVNLLWPDYDSSRGRTTLRATLYALSRSLKGEPLKADRETIAPNPDADLWVDVLNFRDLLAQCRTHGHPSSEPCPECLSHLTDAVELYGGDFMTGFSLKDSVNFDDWQISQAQNIHSEMVAALERIVHYLDGEGESDKAIPYAQRWLEMDRTNEGTHRQLMELYAKTGERTAALEQYEQCVKILKDNLGVSPQESTVELYEAIKENRLQAAETPAPKSWKAPSNNLPAQLTSFIGREGEIQEVKGLLASTRLLTLSGSGGCGKTRLALQIAADLLGEFSDGMWIVELASLSDPSLVTQEVASVLGVREESDSLPIAAPTPGDSGSSGAGTGTLLTKLLTYLQQKEILLMLDNCEHLIDACASLSETLLQACPNLKILATSREALGIVGETPWNVSPLSIPDSDDLPSLGTSDLSKYEALRLFSDRVETIIPTFEMTERNVSTVARICLRLDGIPLAIELAAARLKTLSVEEITDRLDDRFRLLTGGSRTALPRQQTLRAAIDWSYNLLSQPERVLLGRLSVFMDGWTLAATEGVCAGESLVGANIQISSEQILDLLTGLVEKSLVIAEEEEGKTRYYLLETVRQYARDKLLESDESVSLRDRHLAWFLDLAEEAEDELHGPHQVEWLDRLKAEHDNIRAALEWSKEAVDNSEAGVRLAAALPWFWIGRGYGSEGRKWIEKVTSQSRGVSAAVRARALIGAGYLASFQSDYKPVAELGEESLSLAREAGDKKSIAHSLRILAIGKASQLDFGHEKKLDFSQVKELIEKSLTLSREIGDKWSTGQSLWILAGVEIGMRNRDRAKELFEESLTLSREMGDKTAITMTLSFWGGLVVEEGDYDRGRALFEESLTISRELGSKVQTVTPLFDLGRLALLQGDFDRAKDLLEESLTLYRELGVKRKITSSVRLLGRVATAHEDFGRAITLYQESITLSRESEDKSGIAGGLEALAELLGSKDRGEQAARLYGAAEVLRGTGFPLLASYRAGYDRSVAALRSQLGEEAFATAWAEGRAMSVEDAVEYALKAESGDF